MTSIVNSDDFKAFEEEINRRSEETFAKILLKSLKILKSTKSCEKTLKIFGKKYNKDLTLILHNLGSHKEKQLLYKCAFFYDRQNLCFYHIPEHVKNETKPKKSIFDPFPHEVEDIKECSSQYALTFLSQGKTQKGYYPNRDEAMYHVDYLLDTNAYSIENYTTSNSYDHNDYSFGLVKINSFVFFLNIKFGDNCYLKSKDTQFRNLFVTMTKKGYPKNPYTRDVIDNSYYLARYINFHKRVIHILLNSPIVKKELFENQKIYICKSSDCLGSRGFISDNQSFEVPCMYNCGASFCHNCEGDYHGQIPCGSIDPESLKFMMDNKFQMCPQCKKMIEKTEGCNHIACSCGAHFCYECGREYDTSRSHTRQNPCTNPANNWWVDLDREQRIHEEERDRREEAEFEEDEFEHNMFLRAQLEQERQREFDSDSD